jgi:hypothetical protein
MQTLIVKAEGEKFDALISFMRGLEISFFTEEQNQTYNKEFVKKIEKRRESYKKGEYITVKNINNIWESILSE